MTATEHALELTQVAAQAAADKLGTEIVAFDVSEQLAITDVFLVVTAANERQVGAVVDGVEEALRGLGAKPVAPRGRPRAALGAAGLPRPRRPRAAHRRAALLRPRAALAGHARRSGSAWTSGGDRGPPRPVAARSDRLEPHGPRSRGRPTSR